MTSIIGINGIAAAMLRSTKNTVLLTLAIVVLILTLSWILSVKKWVALADISCSGPSVI